MMYEYYVVIKNSRTRKVQTGKVRLTVPIFDMEVIRFILEIMEKERDPNLPKDNWYLESWKRFEDYP